MTLAMEANIPCYSWWDVMDEGGTHLIPFAKRILGQACSSSSCKMNCNFPFLHIKLGTSWVQLGLEFWFTFRRLMFPHLYWLDSHLFAGLVAVSLRRYNLDSSWCIWTVNPSRPIQGPQWKNFMKNLSYSASMTRQLDRRKGVNLAKKGVENINLYIYTNEHLVWKNVDYGLAIWLLWTWGPNI